MLRVYLQTRKKWIFILTLYAPTAQNGQTQANNSLARVLDYFVVLAPEELIKRSTPFLLVGTRVVTIILIASDRLTPSVH